MVEKKKNQFFECGTRKKWILLFLQLLVFVLWFLCCLWVFMGV